MTHARYSDKAAAFLQLWAFLSPDSAADPECEYRFHPHRRWRFDFAWPDRKLALEIDGGQWTPHGGRHMTDADRDKQNAAAILGWRVMHFSPGQLRDDPEGCVNRVVEALR